MSAPVVVTLDTTLDGNGHSVVVDGQNLTQLFQVNPGVRLTLRELVIANGLAKGSDAADFSMRGGDGYGGALRN
ncbi:MAG TPA: hypothetical protein VNM37_01205, partial [Candidatus Dormibacteraeota bacterium]|nr:hypothetical protein [Candidatus Dormibacteraeota bacterium]